MRELPAARANDQLRRAVIGYAAPLGAPSQPAARAALKLLAAAAAASPHAGAPRAPCALGRCCRSAARGSPPSRDGGDPEYLLRWPSGCADAMLLPAEARAALDPRARSRRAPPPRSRRGAAGAEPPAGLAAPAEARWRGLLLLDLREPAAIAAAADALERNDSRVQAPRPDAPPRAAERAAACQIHRDERCQAVC